MIVLLDTTVLIDVLRGNHASRSILDELAVNGHIMATSAVNVAEVYAGLREAETLRTDLLFSRLLCYPVTQTIGHRAGLIANSWAKRGRTFALTDMLLAATALEHDLTLMTANRNDFPMPELKLYPLGSEPITRT